MSKPITNHMLIEKFSEVNRKVRVRDRVNLTTGGGNAVDGDSIDTVMLVVEKIIQVEGDVMISETGRRARMFSPCPGVHWKCISESTGNVITLRKPLEALLIVDGGDSYCLGVSGVSDEFEVRLQVGENEVRLNNLFLNLVAPHVVRNGLEVKDGE